MKSLSSSHHYNYQSLSMLWSEWLERCWVERPCRHKSHVHKMRVYKWSILIAEENNLDFMAVWLKTNMAKWLVTKQIQACPKVSKIFKGAQTILFTEVKIKYIHLSFKRSFFCSRCTKWKSPPCQRIVLVWLLLVPLPCIWQSLYTQTLPQGPPLSSPQHFHSTAPQTFQWYM